MSKQHVHGHTTHPISASVCLACSFESAPEVCPQTGTRVVFVSVFTRVAQPRPEADGRRMGRLENLDSPVSHQDFNDSRS